MKNRGQLVLGIILILLGGWFIVQHQFPAVEKFLTPYMDWPLNIVAAGALIFVIGLLLNAPGMAIPAAIIAGIGGILYYQKMTEDYQSWSYMWALIPGFLGVGNILAGLIEHSRHQVSSGMNLIVVSAVLFVIFAAIFGKLTILGAYGPAILLILLGLWMLVRGFWRGRKG